jgi:hypothetical protein
MNEAEDPVARALAALAAADAQREAPPEVEARLRARLRALHPGRRATSRPLVLAGLAAALMVAAALVVALWKEPPRPLPRREAARPEVEFAPLVYGEPFEGADALHLTRVRVERSALASFGWPAPQGEEGGGPVEAEVLVGQDGVARGIRFVSDDGGRRP